MLSILLIDDTDCIREPLAMILSDDFYVDEAASVARARKLMAEKRYDCIVTDYHLAPSQTGLELIREATLLGIPSILISSHERLELFQMAKEAGASEVLSKPLSSDGLRRSILAAVNTHLPSLSSEPGTHPALHTDQPRN